MYIFFFCKQKTAYEMRISDWSSDVCSSDLNSEVLIVTDVKRGDLAALSGAYSRLIEAAGGGTLGLFTAIQRLKSVYARIADPLARAGLPLYAQPVDPIDTGTLVEIFRDSPNDTLLGPNRKSVV